MKKKINPPKGYKVENVQTADDGTVTITYEKIVAAEVPSKKGDMLDALGDFMK